MAHAPQKTSRFFESGERNSAIRERPRLYDADLFDWIIDLVSNGEVLTDICLDRDMPLPGTFLRWTREDSRLGDRYREALEIGTEVTFDEYISAAHDSDTARASVRSKALLTRAERHLPEKYGPRVTNRNVEGAKDEAAGIDYAAEVRRRLGAMAERMQRASADAGPVEGGGEPT